MISAAPSFMEASFIVTGFKGFSINPLNDALFLFLGLVFVGMLHYRD